MLFHNDWSSLCWLHVTSKIIFVITYLLVDEHELSLGMLIRPKRIYNFLCSKLCFPMFSTCFPSFSGCFHGLTYYQDAQSQFMFSAVLYFRKVLKEIFSEWAENLRGIIFHRKEDCVQRRAQEVAWGHQRGARRGLGLTHAWGSCGAPRHPLAPPLRL